MKFYLPRHRGPWTRFHPRRANADQALAAIDLEDKVDLLFTDVAMPT